MTIKELRCQGAYNGNVCNKLLLKHEGTSDIEVKCPRCKTINKSYAIKPMKMYDLPSDFE